MTKKNNMKILKISLIALVLSACSDLMFIESIADASCEDLAEQVVGMELTNGFGAQYEILSVFNTYEVSRNDNELVCNADGYLTSGEEKLLLKLMAGNGSEFFTSVEVR